MYKIYNRYYNSMSIIIDIQFYIKQRMLKNKLSIRGIN